MVECERVLNVGDLVIRVHAKGATSLQGVLVEVKDASIG